jgi:hypothetical protein
MLPVFAASRRVSTVDDWLTLRLAMPGKTPTHNPKCTLQTGMSNRKMPARCVHVTFK